MGLRRITAKYASRCRGCGGGIAQGETILWARGEGSRHPACETAAPAPAGASMRRVVDARRPAEVADDLDRQIAESELRVAARDGDEAEYQRGRAEAERYLSDRRIYGAELAEQWEIEREMREGWD